MDSKTLTWILTGLSYALFAAIIVMIPFRIKKIKSECGELKMALKSDFPLRSFLIFAVCAALIGLVPLRNFALYLCLVFDLTALIASWMASKDVANSGINGIYENMIISDTTAIKYSDILSLPTVAWEKQEETAQVDFRLLEVIPEKGGKITLVFPDEKVRNQALSVILEQCPRLAE